MLQAYLKSLSKGVGGDNYVKHLFTIIDRLLSFPGDKVVYMKGVSFNHIVIKYQIFYLRIIELHKNKKIKYLSNRYKDIFSNRTRIIIKRIKIKNKYLLSEK